MSALRDALARGALCLGAAGIDSARLDARLLLACAMAKMPDDLLSAADPTQDQLARYAVLLARRETREPLAYITGEKEFWSLVFEVGPGALVPRPESETLIEAALRDFPDPAQPLNVLDLGTGTGCLLMAFLTGHPQARGLGIEKSAEALIWAGRNLARHGLADRCRLSEADWSGDIIGTFDVIFSNPPYLAMAEVAAMEPEVSRFEPREALAIAADATGAYSQLAPVVARHLSPGGKGYFEIGAGQADRVADIFRASGLVLGGIVPDLGGIPRCVVVSLEPGTGPGRAQKTVGMAGPSR